jgi:hypothetical protein
VLACTRIHLVSRKTGRLITDKGEEKDDHVAYRIKMQRQVRAYRALDTLIGEAVRQSTQIETQMDDF